MQLIHAILLFAVFFATLTKSDGCNIVALQKEADQITTALKKTGQKAHLLYTEDSDIQYFADLSLDMGEHDHGAKKRDQKLANEAEGFLEEQQLRFLRQERERLADERDRERKERLVLHIHHLRENRYHVPRLLRRNKKGKRVSDEMVFEKRGGFFRYASLATTNWPSFLSFLFIVVCDLCAFIAAFVIPYMMIQRLKRPGLMAGTGVRTPPTRSRSN